MTKTSFLKQQISRISSLNNRNLAIVTGVISGAIVGIYGTFIGNFIIVPALGNPQGHGLIFKLGVIILSAGVFGNLLSYVGACLDILTHERTIFDLCHIVKTILMQKINWLSSKAIKTTTINSNQSKNS